MASTATTGSSSSACNRHDPFDAGGGAGGTSCPVALVSAVPHEVKAEEEAEDEEKEKEEEEEEDADDDDEEDVLKGATPPFAPSTSV